MASISFDRIAHRYDETRGGEMRGGRFAAALGHHLAPPADVLEIGVGTGLVAAPLVAAGHRLVGIDLSAEMLAVARTRIPGHLLLGDASVLPVRTGGVDAVVAVWAVHVVGDTDALMAELARVVRPGGRLLVVSSTPDVDSNDLTTIAMRFGRDLGKGWDRSESLAPRLAAHGFDFLGDEVTDIYEYDETPNERAATIERRDWSSLWDLDDETWARVIQPVVDGLRALPDPDRSRRCIHRHQLSVYESSG